MTEAQIPPEVAQQAAEMRKSSPQQEGPTRGDSSTEGPLSQGDNTGENDQGHRPDETISNRAEQAKKEIEGKSNKQQAEIMLAKSRSLVAEARGDLTEERQEELREDLDRALTYNSSRTNSAIDRADSSNLHSLVVSLVAIKEDLGPEQKELAELCLEVLGKNVKIRIEENGQRTDYSLGEWSALLASKGEDEAQALRDKALWGFVFSDEESAQPAQAEAEPQPKSYDLAIDQRIQDLQDHIDTATNAERKAALQALQNRLRLARAANGEEGILLKFHAVQELRVSGTFNVSEEIYQETKRDMEILIAKMGITEGGALVEHIKNLIATEQLKDKEAREKLFGKDIDPEVLERLLKACKTEDLLEAKDVATFGLLLALLLSAAAVWDTTKTVATAVQ
ncbi:hypothetical protein C4577_07855 [Candidatus Parcubacteria bacterium]|nr:MAG: hypothetical protein C4577_07855 [Candidatus Parcubacteria bacterium]